MKRCSTCKKLKPLNCFYKYKRASDGLKSQCKECEKKYEKNRDPEKKKANAKKYREAHKEIESQRLKKWKAENPEKYKAYHSRTKLRHRCRITQMDNITLDKLIERDKGICQLCGKPIDYKDYLIQDGVFIAGNDYPSIDHIKPLSRGGSHTWDNVQLAHRKCNSIKSNKVS